MNAIVAVDRNWAIGKDGGLLFSLPSDMRRFREMTTGGTVLLGRKTLESFPGGRPLPRRRNLVLTSRALALPGAECFSDLEALLAAAAADAPERVFVIGGGSVYAALLSRCDRAFVTQVDAAAPAPDTFFPNLDALPGWTAERTGEPITENGFTYRFVDYKNLFI